MPIIIFCGKEILVFLHVIPGALPDKIRERDDTEGEEVKTFSYFIN
jgi:hypothetical protein